MRKIVCVRVSEREYERMSEINYEWEIEYQRVCVREILSESMCVNERGRECGVFVLVLEGERARKIV